MHLKLLLLLLLYVHFRAYVLQQCNPIQPTELLYYLSKYTLMDNLVTSVKQ